MKSDYLVMVRSSSCLPRLITEEVSVVFHNAATVRFNEPLQTVTSVGRCFYLSRQAMAINVGAVITVLELAKKMHNLKVKNQVNHLSNMILQALVHVSTAYSNTHLDLIPENIVQNTDLGDPIALVQLCRVSFTLIKSDKFIARLWMPSLWRL